MVAEILVPLTTTVGRYSFAHGIVAETIESDLGDATRARLNQRAAIALQTHHRDLPGPHLIPIADHWFGHSRRRHRRRHRRRPARLTLGG